MKDKPRKEAFKIGRKRLGTLYTWPSGRRALIVPRARRDLYRGDHVYVSHAMTAGEAMWSVETMLLSKMRRLGVELVGVHVAQTGAYYLARLSDWAAHGVYANKRVKNGSQQRSLSLRYFAVRHGPVKL